MIRIFKDKDTKVVTKGAYEQFYKPFGYNVIIEDTKVKEEKINKSAKTDENETVIKPKRESSYKKNKKNKKED